MPAGVREEVKVGTDHVHVSRMLVARLALVCFVQVCDLDSVNDTLGS